MDMIMDMIREWLRARKIVRMRLRVLAQDLADADIARQDRHRAFEEIVSRARAAKAKGVRTYAVSTGEMQILEEFTPPLAAYYDCSRPEPNLVIGGLTVVVGRQWT